MGFVSAFFTSAKNTIPGGYRKEYVLGCDEKCVKLYQKYSGRQEREIAEELFHSLDGTRIQIWMETVEKLEFS